jgi:hypothetical protein
MYEDENGFVFCQKKWVEKEDRKENEDDKDHAVNQQKSGQRNR